MHVYIYDSNLDQAKYHSLLGKIETRLTDLGLNGKIVRLNPMHNLEKTLHEEIKKERTLVLVGDNKLFNSALNTINNTDTVLGFIPVGKENNSICRTLGIFNEMDACDILAARRISEFDLGLINNHVFINEVAISTNHILIDIENQLSVEIDRTSEIRIINLQSSDTVFADYKCNPLDGQLELIVNTVVSKSFLKKNQSSFSYFKNSSFHLTGEFTAIIDSITKITAPAHITTQYKAIRLIVGKNRNSA